MELYMAVLLLVAVCLLSKEGAVLVSSMRAAEEKPCIVVDAGHGGDDPGKIGIHGELEKDINLAIAKKVKARLEKENITVILTRETDESLDKGESGSKKVADMRNRCRLIDEAKPLFYHKCPSEQLYGRVHKRSPVLLFWTVRGGQKNCRDYAGKPAVASGYGK